MSFEGKWMEVEITMFSKISWIQKNKYYVFFIFRIQT
jgi:hypothetical protein